MSFSVDRAHNGRKWARNLSIPILSSAAILSGWTPCSKASFTLHHGPLWVGVPFAMRCACPNSAAEELQKAAEHSQISVAELSQPLCTALQIALWNKLSSTGIRPAAVVGHSSGEIAAAYAAGSISMDAAIIAAYYRGFVTKKQTSTGAMAAVGLGPKDVAKFLIDGLVIACENSSSSTTISGDREKVLGAVAKIKEELPDVLARPLKVDMAYHSRESVKGWSITYMLTAMQITWYLLERNISGYLMLS
jgi:malonyl CoA-acyl carrier protein transacylase